MKRSRQIQQECASGAVIHGSVVDAVAVNRLADANVVYMRGKHDILTLERRVGPFQLGYDIIGFDFVFDEFCLGADGQRERKSWQRLAFLRQGRNLLETVPGTRKQHLRMRWIEHDGGLFPFGFVKLLSLKIHAGMRAIERDPRPWDIHERRIWNRDDAHHTRRFQRLPALSCGLVVRGQRTGNGQRGAGNNHCNLSLELKAIEVVVAFFRDVQPVTDEHQRRFDLGRQLQAGIEVRLLSEGERHRLPVTHQREAGILLADFPHHELNGLIEALAARRLHPERLELLHDILLSAAKSRAAGFTAFELIIGEKLHVFPPGLAVESRLRGLAGRRWAGRRLARRRLAKHRGAEGE